MKSMIDSYRNDCWMELLEGVLHHIAWMNSNNHQSTSTMKQILPKRFAVAASLDVVELTKGKYTATEKWILTNGVANWQLLYNWTWEIWLSFQKQKKSGLLQLWNQEGTLMVLMSILQLVPVENGKTTNIHTDMRLLTSVRGRTCPF